MLRDREDTGVDFGMSNGASEWAAGPSRLTKRAIDDLILDGATGDLLRTET